MRPLLLILALVSIHSGRNAPDANCRSSELLTLHALCGLYDSHTVRVVQQGEQEGKWGWTGRISRAAL